MNTLNLEDIKDPFAAVVQSLKDSLSSIQPVTTTVEETANICNEIAGTLDYAIEVPPTLTTCQESLEVLSSLCQALIEIPFIDVVAEMASGIMDDAVGFLGEVNTAIDPIIEDTVKPCQTIFNELADTMNEADTIIKTISTTVPDVLNTVQILSYCLDITQQVLPVLAGTKAEESTQNFVDQMVNVRTEVTKVLKPLAEFTSDISKTILSINSALGDSTSEIQSTLTTVKNGLGNFENIISPIKSAFHAIENAIAPVKWVLDAMESIIKHILEPVVNAVLKATGIESLLQPLLNEIEKALGVQPLFDLVKTNINTSTSSNWQQNGGTQTVQSGSAAWTTMNTSLSKYDSRDKGKTYDLVVSMVQAISGSPSGKGPFNLPNWPVQPSIKGIQSNSSFAIRSIEIAKTQQRIVRQKKMKTCYLALAEITTPYIKTASNPLWVSDVLLNDHVIKDSYDDIGLTNITLLLQAAKNAKNSLESAETIGPTLAKNLKSFDLSRALPTHFHEEIDDFNALFLDGVKVMDFLLNFDWAKGIFTDIEQSFKDQAKAINDIYLQTTALVKSGESVDSAIQQVEAHNPSKQQFTSALQYIDQIASSAASLGNTLRRGLALNSKLDNQFSSDLEALKTEVNTGAETVLKQMQNIQSTISYALSQADAINNYLSNYAQKFIQLGKDAELVSSTGLPQLSKAVKYSNTFASILDPLTGILVDMNCIAKNPITTGANIELSLFKRSMKTIITTQSPAITKALNFIIAKLLPTNDISNDISAINNFVSTNNTSFTSSASNLSKSFDQLKNLMTPIKSFNYSATVSYKSNPPITIGPDGKAQGGGATKTKVIHQKVNNFFVDQDLQQKLLALVNKMNDAANKANLNKNINQ
ncbi:MAG: hypothetical protein N4A35_09055 [Flavobacteriales bacterium]|jgi:hypothetical protein|nr:hypothetical protein [Flavobacteriales bacterium]